VETQSPSVGPRIVRAWFDTLINPLIAALESEMRVLGQRDFTWRFRPAGFELVRKVEQHLDSLYRANLDQFLAIYRSLAAQFQDHDNRVERLRLHVGELHALISRNEEFLRVLEASLSFESLQTIGVRSIDEVFGAYPKEDGIQLIAQYLVNNTAHLPAHHSTAKFWNLRRAEFREILSKHGIVDKYESVLCQADELGGFDSALVETLKDLRLSLSLRVDQPFVAPEAGSPQRWLNPA